MQKRRDYGCEYDASLDTRNAVNAAMNVNENMNATKDHCRSITMTPCGLEEYQIGGVLLPSLTSSPSSRWENEDGALGKLTMEKNGIGFYDKADDEIEGFSLNSTDSLKDLLPSPTHNEE